MKVVLVNPPRSEPEKLAKKVHPPLNLLYLATALDRAGIAVEVLDANAADLTIAQIADRLRVLAPGLIGFPLFSDIIAPTYRLVELTRAALPQTKIVLGGIHVSADPPGTAAIFTDADFFLAGYAENSLTLLAQTLRNGGDLNRIPRLTFRIAGQIVTTPDADDEFDIDAVPIPDRRFVREHYERGAYYQIMNTRPLDSIVTSRGCKFACRFCYNAIRRGVAHRSAENIYEEIVQRYEAGMRFLDIDDDNFTQERERMGKIFAWIRRDKLDLKLFLKSRSDALDRVTLSQAKAAGTEIISFGIESGVQHILDAMHKGTKVERNAEVIEKAKRAGIMVHAGFLLGYPGETPETIAETIRFVNRAKPDAVSLQVLKPYLGTAVYAEAQAAGTLVGSWDPREPGLPWVRLPWTQSRDDLENWAKIFARRVYLRPYYAWRIPQQIVKNANRRMARYALQNLRGLIK